MQAIFAKGRSHGPSLRVLHAARHALTDLVQFDMPQGEW